MSGDYSRHAFDPWQDDLGVLLQQGRPLSDADWNAMALQMRRRLHAGTLDTIGAAVVPLQTPDAFAIAPAGGNLEIGIGRLYVDGMLAQNHGAGPRAWDRRLEEQVGTAPRLYASADPDLCQPYFPDAPALPASGRHLVYLDVWQREVTHLMRPDLVEPAVGVDSCTRLQTVWQVKLIEDVGADASCATSLDDFPALAPSAGRLSTGTAVVPGDPDPCLIPPGGGYKGLENQLYRVEVHTGGAPGTATFKWSRENASVATRVTGIPALDRLVVDSVGRDSVLRFNEGDWVEVTDDWRELHGLPGELRRIRTANGVDDTTRMLMLETPLSAGLFPTGPGGVTLPARNTRVKRWDQRGQVRDKDGNPLQDLDAGGSGGIVIPAAATAIALEHGIVVTLQVESAGGQFRSGDHWLFWARSATAKIEILEQAPPLGIHHHYAKLGFVSFPGGFEDCRQFWPPPAAAAGEGCACTVCVSPEQHAAGAPSLQQAIDQVIAAGGGTICLDVGEYGLAAPLKIVGVKPESSLRIVGKGVATRLFSGGAVFDAVEESHNVHLGQFWLGNKEGPGDVRGMVLRDCAHVCLDHLHFEMGVKGPAIGLAGALADVSVRSCGFQAQVGIGTIDKQGSATGLMDLRIEDNQFDCKERGVQLTRGSVHQSLTRIAGNRFNLCRAVALAVEGATTPGSGVEISGNTFAALGDAIVAGVDGLRVARNQIAAFKPPGSGVGVALVEGLAGSLGLSDCQVAGNRISGLKVGVWMQAPLASAQLRGNQMDGCSIGILSDKPRPLRELAIEGNQLTRMETAAIVVQAMRGADDPARIVVQGNQFDSAGSDAGVQVSLRDGDIAFADNHGVHARATQSAVLLEGRSLVATSNRITGGRQSSIELTCNKSAYTAVGNLTGNGITNNGGALDPKWIPLNPVLP